MGADLKTVACGEGCRPRRAWPASPGWSPVTSPAADRRGHGPGARVDSRSCWRATWSSPQRYARLRAARGEPWLLLLPVGLIRLPKRIPLNRDGNRDHGDPIDAGVRHVGLVNRGAACQVLDGDGSPTASLATRRRGANVSRMVREAGELTEAQGWIEPISWRSRSSAVATRSRVDAFAEACPVWKSS